MQTAPTLLGKAGRELDILKQKDSLASRETSKTMPQESKQSVLEKLKLWKRPSLQNKTLWHWLELLIVPVVLAVGAALIQWQSGVRQENVTTDRNRQETLAKYLEQMTVLLIDKHLRSSQPGSEVRVVARARTLTALRELDGERKGQLILFLAEAGLINKRCDPTPEKQDCTGIISLRGANLNKADIQGASVGRSKFTSVNLQGADLQGADLEASKLAKVNLKGSNLQEADLEGANLQEANLTHADLRSADLKKADLSGAELRGACYDAVTDFTYDFDPVSEFKPDMRGMVLKLRDQICSP